ncbi:MULTISPECIES: transmembrane Fragile-X-F protein [unclassified Lysinibacillus]|uniref:transmembrane Fragile-X-F protein n=1 Tax=unclassified Lysinibacillus TaxID=2636778 RepID=UPI0038255BDF
MGVAEVLTIVFIVLKLTEVITWSWWLVLLPSIISFSIYVLIVLVKIAIVIATIMTVKKRKER